MVGGLALGALTQGCDARPVTTVTITNHYSATSTAPLVVYRARWQAVTFAEPVTPGSSATAQTTVSASKNTAYVVLAPGWDPASLSPPRSLVVMQSRDDFEVHLDDALDILIDDANFIGNCVAGSFLSLEQADFITRLVFPADFASLRYEPATCAVTPVVGQGDAGAD